VKNNGILVLPTAHSKGSPTEVKFEQSGNSSPQFTSSFPTSEQRERKMKTFIMRHAFVLLILVMFILGSGIATFLVLYSASIQFKQVSTDQTAQTIATSAFFPTATAGITSISVSLHQEVG
jgi:hypothetical protein